MRVIGLIGAVAGLALPLAMPASPSAAVGAEGRAAPPAMASSYQGADLIDHAERHWNWLGSGWTLSVYPTAWLRYLGGDYAAGEAAWEELVEKYPDDLTENVDGMHDQMLCHVLFGWIKDTYNLDEWRPDVGFVATIEADCDPDPEGW